ncbi:MAG: class I SAM-dependent methyltransferase [bacterium]
MLYYSKVETLLFHLRNIRSSVLFRRLKCFCSGNVLDIGGGSFFQVVNKYKLQYDSWTIVETLDTAFKVKSLPGCTIIAGNGCCLPFNDNTFSTIFNIQVLEHVFEPEQMVKEISRVLLPGGKAVLMVPQTSVLHHAPSHYYNFTKFWVEKVAKINELEIIEYHALGGFWTSMASHLFYFILKALRAKGYVYETNDAARSPLFYILLPFMILFVFLSIPLCLLFGLADFKEDPNNHILVVKKTLKNNTRK